MRGEKLLQGRIRLGKLLRLPLLRREHEHRTRARRRVAEVVHHLLITRSVFGLRELRGRGVIAMIGIQNVSTECSRCDEHEQHSGDDRRFVFHPKHLRLDRRIDRVSGACTRRDWWHNGRRFRPRGWSYATRRFSAQERDKAARRGGHDVSSMADEQNQSPMQNPEKPPDEWVTKDEPMTGPQRSY